MRVVVFVSGGGGNLKAAIQASAEHPGLLTVRLVVSDRLGIPAIAIAEEYGIPVIARDFESSCGVWALAKRDPQTASAYRQKAEKFHDGILTTIRAHEKAYGFLFDLAVLSYHRWIQGKLLAYFQDRMINQHAGDATVMRKDDPLRRAYVGINPVLLALRSGETRTRTSTFLVTEGHDTGEILCQGPWVPYEGSYPVTKESGWQHEVVQKERSDWPSLKFALCHIAEGDYAIAQTMFHKDHTRVLFFKGKALTYGGIDLQLYA